ncbi:molybdenum cofactor biosynthesis protein MoaE [Actinomyces marmotae]|uniref:Molybdenum cofactor biosynthesis protein MoaE n=1 Tax=Actinomyces marmotae TaxID=2737173 RepID=A0A6M8B0H7_9ACTO|nr:molybdenum cofactor biosynthesis protein MoaE [Actinomyces marmotae]QKD79232.1 molybdenum cofactor biosynthesis protein MoaE [Actinomyces marmotae]
MVRETDHGAAHEATGAEGRGCARIARAEMTEGPVSAAELARAVADRAAGAVVTFDGMVRDHDGGRAVESIAYSAHPSAGEVIERIAADVAARPGLRALAIVHRTGELAIGDTALGVAASADHRAEAFAAVSDAVEEVKRRLPVWKNQRFSDGTTEWSNCA